MIYGDAASERNALLEEKYRDLAEAFINAGFEVHSILYNDDKAEALATDLLHFNAILVWVNPIEQGHDRQRLDALLKIFSKQGILVSTHPDIILKMGTKDVLYTTRDMDWGGDVKLYPDYVSFAREFPQSLHTNGKRVLKQYRGNGGNGVFKIVSNLPPNDITVIHAKGNEEQTFSSNEFFLEFSSFFDQGGLLIDQPWNPNFANGMVRCYLSGDRVAGFGYQEINALYESPTNVAPSKRYYYSEDCGLFCDLKLAMEQSWVPLLQQRLAVDTKMLPVIWDADFFINTPNNESAKEKYTLCEINVSCVSPFPPSAIKFIVNNIRQQFQSS